jgi:Glycosyl hydrolase family 62
MRQFVNHLAQAGFFLLLNTPAGQAAESTDEAVARLHRGLFRWSVSTPLVSPATRSSDRCYSVKDPTIVRFEDRWHLFTTIRSEKRTHQIEYLNFRDWADANKAERHILTLSDSYFCAPQVFYFTPHKKWYLIYQVVDNSRKPALQPAYSTSTDIAAPGSWTAPRLLFENQPANVSAWIDFWIICDETKAHLFFTSNNGLLWRAETRLDDFPRGWSVPGVVLRDDIFEASHTYHLADSHEYLTIVEAQGAAGRRYYKAYLAPRLDGEWKPLAATSEKPFASRRNVRGGESWTDSFSHGELIRTGSDEKLEVDPGNLRFLFQGVSDAARAGKNYGEIPWQLGLLEPER